MKRKKGTRTQLPILKVLWDNPKTDVALLQRRTGFTKQQIWSALYGLKERKLIKKDPIKRKAGYKILPVEKIEIRLLKETPFQIDRLRGLLGRKKSEEPIESPKEEKGGVEKRYIVLPSKLE